MAQFDNGNDKDFVLSSEYQDRERLEPGEDTHYGSGSGAAGGRAFKHIYIAIAGFLTLIILTVVVIARTYSLAEKAQLLALESRLEQLESHLGSIEGEGGLSQAGSGSQLILLTERLDQLETHREHPVAIVCRTDRRSAKAAALLSRNGFAHVHVVRGGMTDWNAAGLAVERNP